MQTQTPYNKLTNILIHISVWTVFALAIFFYRPVFSNIDTPYQFWIRQAITLVMLITAFYLNSLILVPKLLFNNHRAWYFLIIIVVVLAIVFIHGWVDKALRLDQVYEEAFRTPGQIHSGPSGPDQKNRIDTTDILTIFIGALVVCISTAIASIQKWQKDNQERKELEQDKITSELSFLKAQINPHFFFNTLNNIYVLTSVDPKVAGEAIHQLSKLMRYLLYDTQKGDNRLSQEIAFIKNYISLMKLRLTDIVKMNIDTPTDLQDMPLAPMILLPFVENAFKHGISATEPSHISITITQKNNVLDLIVNNSIMKDNGISLDTNSGIGLVNTRRRLDLLYPGKYKLDISDKNAANEYIVHLILDLS